MGGGGSFVAPGWDVSALAAAPHGGTCWFNGPCAVRNPTTAQTYIGYVNGTNGDVCARTVDDTTLSVGAEQVVYPGFEIDDHDAPSFLVRASDGYVCMGFALHVGDLYFAKGLSAGVLPTGLSGGQVVNITSQVGTHGAGYGYTYAGLAQLSSEANTLYMFFRWHNSSGAGHVSYSKSTDNGATWGARVDVAAITYHQFVVSGTDRIDFVCSPHPDPANADITPASIYHFYMKAGLYYKSDGTQITASLPFAPSDMTLIYDGTTTVGWLWDVAMGVDGKPVVTYVTYPTQWSDHRYNYARWTGSAWDSHEIVSAGGPFCSGSVGGATLQSYSGGVVLDREDPTKVMCSVGVGGGVWESRLYATVDGGANFTYETIEANGMNIRPIGVQGHHPSLQWVWSPVDFYNTYLDYSEGTSGAGI
jgi:hypothetical protein